MLSIGWLENRVREDSDIDLNTIPVSIHLLGNYWAFYWPWKIFIVNLNCLVGMKYPLAGYDVFDIIKIDLLDRNRVDNNWEVLLQNLFKAIRKSLYRIQQKLSHKMSQPWSYFDEWGLGSFCRINWTHISLNFILPSPWSLLEELWRIHCTNAIWSILQLNSSIANFFEST